MATEGYSEQAAKLAAVGRIGGGLMPSRVAQPTLSERLHMETHPEAAEVLETLSKLGY